VIVRVTVVLVTVRVTIILVTVRVTIILVTVRVTIILVTVRVTIILVTVRVTIVLVTVRVTIVLVTMRVTIVLVTMRVTGAVPVELDRVEVVGELEDADAVLLGRLQRGDEVLLELEPVGDHEVGFTEHRRVRGRGLEPVGVGARRHDHLDRAVVTDEVRDDVPEDARRRDDEEVAGRFGRDLLRSVPCSGVRARVRLGCGTAGGSDQTDRGESSEQASPAGAAPGASWASGDPHGERSMWG
jgi:hypothetical protein